MTVPAIRIRAENRVQVRNDGVFVLYWMTANRRLYFNYALDRAVEWAQRLNKPLLILEGLSGGFEWMSERTHRFIIEGMIDNRAAIRGTPATYYAYIERKRGEGKGLLTSLSADACVVVTDRFPAYIYPSMIGAAARDLSVCLESVDSCGLLPLNAADHAFITARSFRKFVDQHLPVHLAAPPQKDPLSRLRVKTTARVDQKITSRWPAATANDLRDLARDPGALPVDHSVKPVSLKGGIVEARATLERFLQSGRPRSSGLSPYLHFGHISAHEIYAEAKRRMKPNTAAAFLDQLVTWRELGFNFCAHRSDYDEYESLPAWAQRTLAIHSSDPRPVLYTEKQLERAQTHDDVWNAAQNQLVTHGTIPPYERMLWGKKILEWSPTPQRALATAIHLNNKYAIDGRDPNSYNGIFWVFGRYDRPFGPERPIFGLVRYMSSENTARKMRSRKYREQYGSN